MLGVGVWRDELRASRSVGVLRGPLRGACLWGDLGSGGFLRHDGVNESVGICAPVLSIPDSSWVLELPLLHACAIEDHAAHPTHFRA